MVFEEIKNIKSDKKELKKFGLTISIVLLIISMVLFYYNKESYKTFSLIGALFILLGYFLPKALLPIHKAWMGLAIILGWISTRVILSIIFYLVITPIRIIASLFGKKFLDLEIQKEKQSYWNYRTKKDYEKIETERQF